ncbi:MAG: DUF3307 domain-containing protein [Proteobacteria bacterium]|nr:DUF3307 domain-containing protein [Pseudomonadota bacterium]
MVAFLAMLIAHAVCDYPLQGDWLSKAKNHNLSLVPGEVIWPHALAAHAGIHAGAVWFLTGSIVLGALEFVAHCLIDWAKCDGRLSYNQDQALHVLCKVVWAVLLAKGLVP